ncbi:MAG: molybdopterin molybdotransferase MoeA [Lachnospiraceae bacterium]|nr:molybdopterin molybdotransferase MoeA [Lachnospiraceae bacterium]
MQIEECLGRILDRIQPSENAEYVQMEETICGRILAEDILAKRNVPSFPRSAMDGYAVHSEDVSDASREVPAVLKVQGELCAGDVPLNGADYGRGTAVRIMTGAYVPEAYDAVVMQEMTDYGMEQVEIYAPVKAYQNYCKVGEDIAEGSVLAKKGTGITPAHMALFASLGITSVPVMNKAKVAVISTGSELMNIWEEPEPGKIYNSIFWMLKGAIEQQGLSVMDCPICRDEEDKLKAELGKALSEADFIITTGGVSVGKKDIVPKVLKEMGAEILFHGADIQPGTPTLGAYLDGKVVLALSGNPYAALANFELYFWAAMAKRMGSKTFLTKCRNAVLKSDYNKVNKHRRLIRAYYEDGEVRLPSGVHASSVISNLTECNCFIDLEAGRAVQVGDTVRVRLLRGF